MLPDGLIISYIITKMAAKVFWARFSTDVWATSNFMLAAKMAFPAACASDRPFLGWIKKVKL